MLKLYHSKKFEKPIAVASILAAGTLYFGSTVSVNAEQSFTPIAGQLVVSNTKTGSIAVTKTKNWWEAGGNGEVLHIIVDKTMQRLSVFADGNLVSQTNVSTGKQGHTTPNGIFSILEKRRRHFSNLYNNAPMPYMQRLTWSGIALHESKSVPAYPASHGCVRMPGKFAPKLFKFTSRGAQVIISNRDLRPLPFSSPKLPGANTPLLASAQLRPAADSIAHMSSKVQKQEDKAALAKDIPMRVLITRFTGRERVKAIQALLNELNYDAGVEDGLMGRATGKAITAFQKDYRHKVTGGLTEELLAQLYRATGKGKPEEGRLYVRSKQKTVFEAPLVISDFDTPLGTHQFTAISGGDQRINWLSLSMEMTKWSGSNENSPAPSNANQALDRIDIPKKAQEFLDANITIGSTIIIADKGISREFGKGTDFIILTR